RHTRLQGDWSSDVCSSDLALEGDEKAAERLEEALPLTHADLRAALTESPRARGAARLRLILTLFDDAVMPALPDAAPAEKAAPRSEERRVGKEGRCGGCEA